MIEPSPNCFSMAATVLRSSTLDSSTLVGLVPAERAGFLGVLSDLLSVLAIRVLEAVLLGEVLCGALETTVPAGGRWLVAVTMKRPFIY